MSEIVEFTHQPLAEGGILFGESPRYHNGRLFLSDMTGCAIYTVDPDSGEKKLHLKVDQQPNGMFFQFDGSLIYSSMFDARLYRLKDGESTLFSDLSNVMTGYCGDMFIDQKGRVYLDDAGARIMHGEEPAPGRLVMVDTDGTAKSVAEGLMFPNALVMSKDGKSLFVAETFGPGLAKYDVGSDGELSNKTLFWSPTSLPDYTEKHDTGAMVAIDGGCIDDDDNIWLSMLGYEQFIRLDKNGQINARIKVKGHATACYLGGSDGKTLFLVVNEVLAEYDLFAAVKAKKTRCNIATARVDVGVQQV